MPSRAKRKASASALRTFAACLNLRAPCFAIRRSCSDIGIEPNANGRIFCVRICYHRRIQFAVLYDKYLVSFNGLFRWIFFP